MEHLVVERPETHVVGIATRTTNAAEAEPATARIGRLWQRVFAQGVPSRVTDPADGGQLCAVYTDYESDHRGEYTLVVGSATKLLARVPLGLVALTVPAGRYACFTARGAMPQALIEAWQRILDHFAGGAPHKRTFRADLEVHHPGDPTNGTVDVYVAIE